VEALPLTNSPAVFGLHPNAEIGYYSAATRDMWRDLLSLQPRKPGRSDGPSREDTIAQIARDISAKVRLSNATALGVTIGAVIQRSCVAAIAATPTAAITVAAYAAVASSAVLLSLLSPADSKGNIMRSTDELRNVCCIACADTTDPIGEC
jgi:hypothetical protein